MSLNKVKSAALTSAILVALVGGSVKAADIVDTAFGAEEFSTLAAALGAAGRVDPLRGEGPLTVYAPIDEAFAALPKGTV